MLTSGLYTTPPVPGCAVCQHRSKTSEGNKPYLLNNPGDKILTTFRLQLAISVQIALRDEMKLNVRGSVSFQKLMRSRTLTLRKTKASLIFPSKSGQYVLQKEKKKTYLRKFY